MSVIETVQRNKDNYKKPTRYYSSRQEKKVANRFGGIQTKNSGATPFQKGDVTLDNWLIECKTCEKEKQSFSIKKQWLEKNLEESMFMGKKFNALMFNFGPDQKNYVIMDEDTFEDLINKEDN